MSKIRDSARGERCLVCLVGVCNHNPETTVLAHFRLAGYAGVAIKPPDFMAAYCCSACHDVVDGRVKTDLTHEEIQTAFCQGVMRTMVKLCDKGLIVVK